MKPFMITFCLLVFATLSLQSTFACSCAEIKNTAIFKVGLAPTDNEIKEWRAHQSDVALFVGRVVKIERVHVTSSQGSKDKLPMRKVTVAVQYYWLGITRSEMVIYTGVGHGDCGVHYFKRKEYFFWATRDPFTHLLETNICSSTTVEPKLMGVLDEIFGRARAFI